MSPRLYGTFIFRLKNQASVDVLYKYVKASADDSGRVPVALRHCVLAIQDDDLKVKLKIKTTKDGIVCTLPTGEKIKLPKKPFPLRVVSGTIYHTADGYKIKILYAIRTKARVLDPEKIVGIDLGVHKIVTSEPETYKFPKRLLKTLEKRDLENKDVKRQLTAFYTQVVVKLCKTYDYIAVEKFNPHFQPIAGTELFYEVLKRQTQKYGKQAVFVNPKNTSKRCATCNSNLKPKNADLQYCPKCKKAVNRDVNAATNVKNLALRRSDSAGFVGTLPAPDHPPCGTGKLNVAGDPFENQGTW